MTNQCPDESLIKDGWEWVDGSFRRDIPGGWARMFLDLSAYEDVSPTASVTACINERKIVDRIAVDFDSAANAQRWVQAVARGLLSYKGAPS